MKQYVAYGYILAAAAAWGCIGLFSRTLLNAGLGAENIVVLRNFGGLLVLASIFALKDRSVFHIEKKHLPIFFGMGIVSVLMFTICYFKCQELCSLAVSAILLYTAPAMVVVMSAAVFHEKLTKRKLLALALALLGCSFVTGLWGGALHVTTAGLLYGLGSAFFYALYSIFGRFGLRHYEPFSVVLWTFIFAGFGSLAFLDLPTLRQSLTTPITIFAAIGLILVATVLPYLLYTKGLAQVESGKASIMASLEPVVAAFVGIAAYGEPANLSVFAGLACILVCVYILK